MNLLNDLDLNVANDIPLNVYFNERYNSISIGCLVPKDIRYAGMIIIFKKNGATLYKKEYLQEYHWIELGEL